MRVKVQKILRIDRTKNGNFRFRIIAVMGDAEDVFTLITRSDEEARQVCEGEEIDIIPIREVPYILNGQVGNGKLDSVLGSLKS